MFIDHSACNKYGAFKNKKGKVLKNMAGEIFVIVNIGQCFQNALPNIPSTPLKTSHN